MRVIGTAGHVDHGKTLLIEALTGIDADRLPEEKRRGLTIDLGFAHFYAPDGQPVGVIDVPGHERFIRNMAAGAWSLDLALLTVASDDGWMQQTADHIRVLRLMGVPRLIAVITKADLASPERLRQVTEQAVRECSLRGYPVAPAVAVSARTGQGIETLKALVLEQLAALPAPAGGFAHLYVDRAFTVKGSGVVVTGSLVGGFIERGQELLLLPRKKRVRVRGLQSYYQECEQAEPVSRVAVNLAGVDLEQIGRGDLLTEPEAPFQAVREFIARVAPAPGDPPPVFKRDTEVEIAAGTGHQIVRLTRLGPGALARVRLSQPTALLWNQPIVLIQHGGSAILGGSRVLWLGRTGREQRLALAEIEPKLPPELGAEQEALLKLTLEKAVPPKEAANLELSPALRQSTVELGGWIVARQYADELEKRIRELAAAPRGLKPGELATLIREAPEGLLKLVAGRLADRGDLALREGILFPPGERPPEVSPMGRQLLRDLRAEGARGLEASQLKAAGATKELRNLARIGLAVSLDGNIYYDKDSYLDLVRSCLASLELGGILTIAEAKARTELSRKYVIPLLNRMESDGYVKRSGDDRIVAAKPKGTG
ncbi:MAG: selenocysteine-specific translation elongation factor [Spirochaetales bacterium]|nr:selenocysteine-specific translation elongation factor [Spirochaetales bacterium]